MGLIVTPSVVIVLPPTEEGIRAMTPTATDTVVSETASTEPGSTTDEAVVVEDVLVEDVSIDGMCGVY
jgi:mycofactocin precursor